MIAPVGPLAESLDPSADQWPPWRERCEGAPGLERMGSSDATRPADVPNPVWLSWRHFRLERRDAGYWRVTFDHPPINAVTATTVEELAELVGLIELAGELNVVVFDSANPGVYLGHHDAGGAAEGTTLAAPGGPSAMSTWNDLLARLSRAPVVSIACIRGRTCGAGSEFVLACDMRFASRENTLLGRLDVGPGQSPGDGPAARLGGLVGQGRALEVVLAGQDLDGPRAEQYGYVNRVVEDGRLEREVDAIAARLAASDHEAIGRIKRRVQQPPGPEPAPARVPRVEAVG